MNLDSEVRWDYTVSKETKELWNAELDVLQKFREVCEKHGLKWFAVGGTLLGAVRHKGFIPWDDDIDIGMLQEDYFKLCEIGPEEFKDPYFFQSHETDDLYSPWHVKIRRSDTTAATLAEIRQMPESFNKGMYIDIFPIFRLPDDAAEREKLISKVSKLKHQISRVRKVLLPKKIRKREFDLLRRIRYRLTWLKARTKDDYLKMCSEFLDLCNSVKSPTLEVNSMSFRAGNEKMTWPRKIFLDLVELPFEDIKIWCPSDYDTYLKIQYGDYMTPVKGTQIHTGVVFDAHVPYKDYDFSSVTDGPRD
ncbi:MAG: LicD family protein [Clostridia bacterium]|nr:LicD family protein [Clostridia bacterium]